MRGVPFPVAAGVQPRYSAISSKERARDFQSWNSPKETFAGLRFSASAGAIVTKSARAGDRGGNREGLFSPALKIAVLTPMPSASVAMAMSAKRDSCAHARAVAKILQQVFERREGSQTAWYVL